MAAIFFTGFPGFLGAELLPRVLERAPDDHALCLVQPKFRELAEARARAIEEARPGVAGRIRIVEGDITAPLTQIDASEIREVHHLAAAYDLSVKRALGMKVNVDGTRNVLDLAARASRLERVHYVSTCYVSGRFPGVFREQDLDVARDFNNYYEETKQLAELEVRRRMADGMPVTIYRPSVVVGDSTTGATQKFDGVYFVIRWLLRQPRVAVLPVAGRSSRFFFNVVPRDFVIDAIERLSAMPETIGNTYALADAQPLTVDETIDAVGEACGRKVIRIPLTRGIAKASLRYVPGVYQLMRIPAEAVDYFVHPTIYDTANTTRALGTPAPHFRDYLPQLIAFVRAHPEIGSAAMV